MKPDYDEIPSEGLVPQFHAPRPRRYRGYDPRSVRPAVDCSCDEVIVQQSFAHEADINTIVHRFGLVQQAPNPARAGVFGDFTGITDYASAYEKVQAAQDAFMKLSPGLRDRFKNDPGRFYSHAAGLDDDELAALEASVAPPPAPEPVPAPPAPSPPAEGGS